MKNIADSTVAELVAEDYRRADVFRKYDIDFCCGGKVKLEQICSAKDINLTEIEGALDAAVKGISEETDFAQWPLDRLAAHIVSRHHAYVNDSVPHIRQYAGKVARVHGAAHPETVTIEKLFSALADELEMHMRKEEMILFPVISQLAAAARYGTRIAPPPFGSVRYPIQSMESEHEGAGDLLRDIADLSDNYTPPADACNTYRVLYAKLQEFERDLHLHIHLENNLLFPAAIALEEKHFETA